MNTKKITKFLNGIQWLFNINGFERNIVIKKEDYEERAAQICYEEDYQRITLTIYPKFFKETQEFQRKILLHELCHCLTLQSKVIACNLLDGELQTRENIKYENERLTSKIENILDGLLQGRLKYAKEAYAGYINKESK